MLKVSQVLPNFPEVYLYTGYDCACKWASHLRDPSRRGKVEERLAEALGITQQEIELGRSKLAAG
eukprot:1538525-Karenia_brevis.AAC.1